ncbi:MAG: outer membrane beta-barrel protein [Oryzomonas sp.]|uniref:outer membrane protein n=1 Tax=Oryzomonas sp. TaxID=2855186 RepID=UPI00284EEE6E|nr:outer membrane beta-barrel protein [Oryzomonas sp.]MDR3581207.1 outer membrane beta-barrel protein [Oryzomonas sp.]
MKQTCRMILALCLPLLLCGPAWAAHSGPYAGVFLGGNALMAATSNDSLGEFDLRFTPGLLGSAVVGWDFEPGNAAGEGRIELEYSHRINQLDKARFADGVAPAGGNLTADSLLFNFYGVFHGEDRSWSPYVGAGLGAVRIVTSDLTVTGGPLSNDSALALAYQLGLGIDYALTERLSMDLGYRFFSSTRPKFSEVNGPAFKMDYLNNSVVLGLRVGF